MDLSEFKPYPKDERYLVSTKGEVYSVRRKKILKGHPSPEYIRLTLRVEGVKTYRYAHVVVAETFLGNPKGLQVNHKNGVKVDNRVSNLEWVTARENTLHAYKTGLCSNPKLSKRDIEEFYRLVTVGWDVKALKEWFGMGKTAVRNLLANTSYPWIERVEIKPVGDSRIYVRDLLCNRDIARGVHPKAVMNKYQVPQTSAIRFLNRLNLQEL